MKGRRAHDAAEARRWMVAHDLVGRGIKDRAVLRAMEEVPRERFVPPGLEAYAYDDGPLPIGSGQTISQPFIVALMTEALELEPTSEVLEVGAGSGYAAAVLSRCAAHVVAVERLPDLCERARATLTELGYDNVELLCADGSAVLPGRGPFDAICVSAAAPRVPPALVAELAPGGRLVVPVGSSYDQTLVRVRLHADGSTSTDDLGGVRFVPLVGEGGWHER